MLKKITSGVAALALAGALTVAQPAKPAEAAHFIIGGAIIVGTVLILVFGKDKVCKMNLPDPFGYCR